MNAAVTSRYPGSVYIRASPYGQGGDHSCALQKLIVIVLQGSAVWNWPRQAPVGKALTRMCALQMLIEKLGSHKAVLFNIGQGKPL